MPRGEASASDRKRLKLSSISRDPAASTLPITFGYKCAVWLSSIQRAQERLEQLLPRTLFVQFGGAASSLASLGPGVEGIQVRKAMAEHLGLVDPPIT